MVNGDVTPKFKKSGCLMLTDNYMEQTSAELAKDDEVHND